MTENSITPNLIAEFKHRVPDGMKAPEQEVLFIAPSDMFGILDGDTNMYNLEGWTYWTREPVESPRPELPTALCSAITNVRTKDGDEYPVALMTNAGPRPVAAVHSTTGIWWLRDDDIVSFDYAYIAPIKTSTGVLNEEDKSPILDQDDSTWAWDAEWELWKEQVSDDYMPAQAGTKAVLDREFGPIRFAEEQDMT